MTEVIYSDESYRIIGACFNVYNEMGSGFLEAVYQECLEMEFESQRIPFVAQQRLTLSYRGTSLRQTYAPDFVCFGKIILEIKAMAKLTNDHHAQVLNYIHATEFQLGLLVNFGSCPKLEHKRMVLTEQRVSTSECNCGDLSDSAAAALEADPRIGVD